MLHVLWSAGNFILILERHQRLFRVIPRDVSHMLHFCHFYVLLCTWGWALSLTVAISLPPCLSLLTIPFFNCFPFFSFPPLWPTSLHHVALHLLPMNVASKSVASFRRFLISHLVSQQFLSFCFSTYKFVIHQIEQNFKRLVQVCFGPCGLELLIGWFTKWKVYAFSSPVLSCECALVFSG